MFLWISPSGLIFLLAGAEEKILTEFREACHIIPHDFHLQAMVRSAGKLVLIDKLLPKLKAGGHKVLIDLISLSRLWLRGIFQTLLVASLCPLKKKRKRLFNHPIFISSLFSYLLSFSPTSSQSLRVPQPL